MQNIHYRETGAAAAAGVGVGGRPKESMEEIDDGPPASSPAIEPIDICRSVSACAASASSIRGGVRLCPGGVACGSGGGGGGEGCRHEEKGDAAIPAGLEESAWSETHKWAIRLLG